MSTLKSIIFETLPDAEEYYETSVMHRGRVASKVRLDITCRPLKSSEAQTVLQAIYPEYVTVRYTDPQCGPVTKTMYSNSIPTLCATAYEDGTAV